jgi:hypothetical protein
VKWEMGEGNGGKAEQASKGNNKKNGQMTKGA